MVHHWALQACISSFASCMPLRSQDLASTIILWSATYSKPFEPFHHPLPDDHPAGHRNVRPFCSRPITQIECLFAVLRYTAAKSKCCKPLRFLFMSRDKDWSRLCVDCGAQQYAGLPGQLLPAPLYPRRTPAIFGLETGDPWPRYRTQAKNHAVHKAQEASADSWRASRTGYNVLIWVKLQHLRRATFQMAVF